MRVLTTFANGNSQHGVWHRYWRKLIFIVKIIRRKKSFLEPYSL